MTTPWYAIVAGCGRFGSQLADRLSREGHSVVALDRDPTAFEALSTEFSGYRLEADVTEIATLRLAKAERADLLVAATERDSVNLLVAQIAAHIFLIPRIVARVYDPSRERIYRKLGIATVSPTALAVEEVFRRLSAEAEPGRAGAGV